VHLVDAFVLGIEVPVDLEDLRPQRPRATPRSL
jgi:hypothetical protein